MQIHNPTLIVVSSATEVMRGDSGTSKERERVHAFASHARVIIDAAAFPATSSF